MVRVTVFCNLKEEGLYAGVIFWIDYLNNWSSVHRSTYRDSFAKDKLIELIADAEREPKPPYKLLEENQRLQYVQSPNKVWECPKSLKNDFMLFGLLCANK